MPHAFFIGSKIATVHRITNYTNDSSETLVAAPIVIAKPEGAKSPKLTFSRLSSYYLGFVKNIYPSRDSDELDNSNKSPVESSAVSSIEPEDPDLPRTLEMIRIHIMHVSIDITISLITLAIAINSAILIVAGAVFFYGDAVPPGSSDVADLFAAYDLVATYVGPGSLHPLQRTFREYKN